MSLVDTFCEAIQTHPETWQTLSPHEKVEFAFCLFCEEITKYYEELSVFISFANRRKTSCKVTAFNALFDCAGQRKKREEFCESPDQIGVENSLTWHRMKSEPPESEDQPKVWKHNENCILCKHFEHFAVEDVRAAIENNGGKICHRFPSTHPILSDCTLELKLLSCENVSIMHFSHYNGFEIILDYNPKTRFINN